MRGLAAPSHPKGRVRYSEGFKSSDQNLSSSRCGAYQSWGHTTAGRFLLGWSLLQVPRVPAVLPPSPRTLRKRGTATGLPDGLSPHALQDWVLYGPVQGAREVGHDREASPCGCPVRSTVPWGDLPECSRAGREACAWATPDPVGAVGALGSAEQPESWPPTSGNLGVDFGHPLGETEADRA